MPYFVEKEYDKHAPNFLGSEIGLIPKTFEISPTGVSADADGRKIVKAGTVYPKNDATAKGIVYKDVDVTNGARDGAVLIAGRVLENRLPVAPAAAAKTALEDSGIYFDTAVEITR